MTRISVIITTYNRSSYLKEAIDSVMAQDCAEFDLTVVDDGSSDETRSVVKSYGKKIGYVYQENRGISSARNRGIRSTSGEHVAFLDSDDLWLPDKLSSQMSFFRANPHALICYTDEIWIRRGRRVNPMKKHKKYSGMIFEHCLPLCIISPSSAMFRRTLADEIGLFDENLPACEDYDYWLRVSVRYPVYLLSEPLIVKRGGHEDQLSKHYVGMDRFRIAALTKILDEGALSVEQARLAAEELKRKCDVYGKGCLKRGRFKEALKYLSLPDRYL
jgi:glycosyltransferase involved in cell wall biosynthesis